jgi:glycosyltransferase involved in cell wall biosynthesis
MDAVLFKHLSRVVWQRARCVVANSPGLRDRALAASPQERILVVPNGVDARTFRPAARTGDSLRVLSVARLVGGKGLEYLVRACSELRNDGVSLTLVGGGPDEPNLRRLARESGSDNIRFAGTVPHDRIADHYRHADVFVLPSLSEGLSNSVLEAMACGLPLLLTDTSGTQQMLRDGVNGFVIGERSAADIVGSLRRYLDDPGLLALHGGRSREIALSASWGSIAETYRRIYREMLGSAH